MNVQCSYPTAGWMGIEKLNTISFRWAVRLGDHKSNWEADEVFDAVSFGKRVQERRKAQGLTQEQLGAAFHESRMKKIDNLLTTRWKLGLFIWR